MAHIEHYEFGRIVVDGQEERRDLIILPDLALRAAVPAYSVTSRGDERF